MNTLKAILASVMFASSMPGIVGERKRVPKDRLTKKQFNSRMKEKRARKARRINRESYRKVKN